MSLEAFRAWCDAQGFKGSNEPRPKNPPKVTVANVRRKFLRAIEVREQMLENPALTVTTRTGETKKPFRWWRKHWDGTFHMLPKYGPCPLWIVGEERVVVVKDEEEIKGVLVALRQATNDGTFDDALIELANKHRNRKKAA